MKKNNNKKIITLEIFLVVSVENNRIRAGTLFCRVSALYLHVFNLVK